MMERYLTSQQKNGNSTMKKVSYLEEYSLEFWLTLKVFLFNILVLG